MVFFMSTTWVEEAIKAAGIKITYHGVVRPQTKRVFWFTGMTAHLGEKA
jgi:hypothetical protein